MHSKTMISYGAAVLSLAGIATPGYAWTHHHRIHSALHESTPAERAQTAQLNRQQLAQAQTASAASANMGASAGESGANPAGEGTAVSTTATGTATQQNGLTTEPTSYQRPGGGAGMNSNAPSSASGSTTATGTGGGLGEDQNVGTPKPNGPTSLQGNPSGTVSPPPANSSSTPH
jgi:hypothetical protein